MATHPIGLSVQEYLRLEESAPERHEYFNGQVFAMAGGTPTHGDISANLLALIKPQLRQSGCYVRQSDQRVRNFYNGLYTYPDLVVSCKGEFDGTTLLNPLVIIEVLSDSTKDYDRGTKFEQYRLISSLNIYFCVSQEQQRVEKYSRQESPNMKPIWSLQEFVGDDSFSIELPCGNLTIQVAEIYADLEFPVPLNIS